MMKILSSFLLIWISALAQANTCPDGNVCSNDETCCLLLTGSYACCPLPNAVCCEDGEHCCPEGYNCDKGLCYLITSTPTNSSDITCPGGKFECPDSDTCCPAGEAFSCCPLPNASCCPDGTHCCPEGTTCDLSHQTCNTPESVVEAALIKSRSNDVICPGGEYQCPDGSTCCLLSTGGYGCCPLPSAVCCDDGVHCCPNGYNCSGGECTKVGDSFEHPNERQIKPKALLSEANQVVIQDRFLNNSVVCPDGHSQCPNGNTCCMLNSGTYGCCPMSLATCCLDHIHCCPHGSQCYAYGKCSALGETADKPLVVPWVRKVPAMPRDKGHTQREGHEDENDL